MRHTRGFTLIELLVVVAILALLIAILLPSLSSARERAKAAVCASAMRQTGQIIHVFAAKYDNRAPGSAMFQLNGADYQSQSWADELNTDVMDQLINARGGSFYGNSVTLYGILHLQQKNSYESFMAGKRFLRCPNYIPAGDWTRYYAMNLDANGYNSDLTNRYPGKYGKADPPDMHGPRGFYSFFGLGADLRRFNPYQFLLVEQEYGNDTTVWAPAANGNGSVILGQAGAPWPPYSASQYAQFSFRHPYFKKGNFLHFDGSVEVLGPKDDINSRRRLSIDQ